MEAGPLGHAGRLGKRAWLYCDDSQHSVMIEPQEFRASASARHADSAAHNLKGDVLHTLRSTEPHNTGG